MPDQRRHPLYLIDRFLDARLQEYAPGLFFQANGATVEFGEGWLNQGNIRLVKEVDPYAKAFECAKSNPEDRRLLEDSLNSLGDAYLAIGEPEKACEIFCLNLKIHPDNETARRKMEQFYPRE